MSDIKLRKVEYQDKERIFEMTKNIWRGNDYIPGVFKELVKDNRSNLLGIEKQGVLIAFANLYLIDESTGWLEALRVDPELTGMGWGKMMVENMCRHAIEKELEELFFSTYYRNKASINLNEKLGFKKCATFTNLYLDLEKLNMENDKDNFTILPSNRKVHERTVWNDWFAIPKGKVLVEDRFPKIARMLVNGNEFLLSEDHKERETLEISPVKIVALNYDTVKEVVSYAVKKGYIEIHLMLANYINFKPFIENGFEYREKPEDVFLFSAKTNELKLR
ncbi:MAG: GNAT family N-acetyltransferase [Kosmotogaceae bacterium]